MRGMEARGAGLRGGSTRSTGMALVPQSAVRQSEGNASQRAVGAGVFGCRRALVMARAQKVLDSGCEAVACAV